MKKGVKVQMNKINIKKCIVSWCILLCIILQMSFVTFAVPFQEMQTGNIRIKLNDLDTPMDGVILGIYKVGTLEEGQIIQFKITAEYKNSGIDLNQLYLAKEQQEAAKTLSSYAKNLEPLKNEISNASGEILFSNIEAGAYLILMQHEAEYGTIAPFLVFIPYTSEDGTQFIYDIDIFSKGELPVVNGTIIINKSVIQSGSPKNVMDTFYFAIFEDETYNHPLEIKSLYFQNESDKTIQFTNIKLGTYYIAETDAKGKPIGNGYKYKVNVDKNHVILTQEQNSQTVNIINELAPPTKPTPPDTHDSLLSQYIIMAIMSFIAANMLIIGKKIKSSL